MNVQLAAIQLAIDADVLSSAESYRRHLEAAAARALDGASADARLVVFPEIAGHLALYALAPAQARKAKTLKGALAAAAARRPLDVLRGVATARVLDARHAVLAALAPDAERWWKGVFGPLAKKHAAYVVAGSHLRLGVDGALTNASLLFSPDGFLLATTDKVNLVPGMEDGAKGGLGLHRGSPDLPIVDTPLGKLATLVGYDACTAPHTQHERFVTLGPRLLERGGVAIVANPSGTTAGQPRETLSDTLAETAFARYGVTAHLVGNVLDLAFAGVSEILERTEAGVRVLARADHADRAEHVSAHVSC